MCDAVIQQEKEHSSALLARIRVSGSSPSHPSTEAMAASQTAFGSMRSHGEWGEAPENQR